MTAPATTAASGLARRGRFLEWAVTARWPVSTALLAVLIGGWELAGQAGSLPDYILAPSGIWNGIVDLATSGELWDLLFPSLKRSLIGFAIGAGLGVLLGILAGVIRPISDLVELPVSFTYPLPKIALFPAFAVWLGFEDRTRILVIALACFYPCYLNAHSGTRAIDPNLIYVARNVGARRPRTIAQVVVPAALPRTLIGLRISLALSFVLLFATETIGFATGIGAEIFRSFQFADYERMYACIAVLGACGFLANALLLAIARRLTPGQHIGPIARV